MGGAGVRRFALLAAVAVLALSLVPQGVPGPRAAADRSTQIAGVRSTPPAPVPALRRETVGASWRFAADRSSSGRGALLVAVIALLWLLRRAYRSGSGHAVTDALRLAVYRHSISLRAPPSLRAS